MLTHELKARLREEYRARRRALPDSEKRIRDERIAHEVRQLSAYQDNDTVFTYVSLSSEIDTTALIEQMLTDGKYVAVPYCVPHTCEMEFYYLTSLHDLREGAFGIREPKPNAKNRVDDLTKGLCIVPAFCYDSQGHRLGYGKGYYDRFLTRFGGQTVGLCYHDFLCHALPCGPFDRAVECIVTEEGVRNRTEGDR